MGFSFLGFLLIGVILVGLLAAAAASAGYKLNFGVSGKEKSKDEETIWSSGGNAVGVDGPGYYLDYDADLPIHKID